VVSKDIEVVKVDPRGAKRRRLRGNEIFLLVPSRRQGKATLMMRLLMLRRRRQRRNVLLVLVRAQLMGRTSTISSLKV
jgi:hypothetical protein